MRKRPDIAEPLHGSGAETSLRTPSVSRSLVGRLGAVLFVLGGGVALVTLPLPQPGAISKPTAAGVDVFAICLGVVLWVVPWDRLRPTATLWIVPMALAVVAAGNHFGGIEPFAYAIYFPLIFAWIGGGHRQWTSLRFAPLAALAYAAPLVAQHRPAEQVATVALVVPVCVIIGEAVAWMAGRLRAAEAAGIDREARLRLLVEQLPAIVWTTDRQLRITSGVGAGLAHLGLAPDELVGMKVEVPLGGETARDTALAAHQAALRGESTAFEVEFRGRPYRSITEPLCDADGKVVGVLGMALDITDERKVRESLQRAYDQERNAAERLRALDELKTAFLHAVSHELNTPLTNILGHAMTLERADIALDEQLRRELTRHVVTNARKLDRLLRDLLDLDRLRRGIIEPQRRATDLEPLIRSVVEELRPRDHNVIIEGRPLVAEVDAPKVERIVENLLSNAVRYTPPGTTVWIRIAPSPDGMMIEVEDDGPGVPDGLKDELFEPFRRGPDPDGTSRGVGIGLSLVARFAQLHGGSVEVADRPGGGASFRVSLPARLVDGAARAS